MHIGLNGVFLTPGQSGGMEIYARELVRELAGRVRVTLFVSRAAANEPVPDGVTRIVLPVDASNRLQWVRAEQQLLPRAAERAGVDVVHSLASTAPARGRFKRVVTIHDLIYLKAPEAHFGLRAFGMRVLVPLGARRSDRVIADSASTAGDVVEHLGVPAGRVDVVPLGLGQPRRVAPLPPDDVRRAFGLEGRRVLLSLSAKRPHKNLEAILRALPWLEPRPVVVLPGYPTPHEAELRILARELGVADDVRFAGWLGDREIEGLFDVADVFVYPSRYEGFGLPVLEAMARGVPVACADRASLPEVAGDAAVLFDPDDQQAVGKAIERAMTDRERLVTAGRERVAHFTWARTADATLKVYERLCA